MTEILGNILSIGNLTARHHSVTLLQGHTHFNKAILANSDTPYVIMKASYIQITTWMMAKTEKINLT